MALATGVILAAAGFTLYGRGATAPRYITAPIERGVIATLVKATGRVEAITSVEVSSQLSGQIAKVFVNFNDTVTAGQPLAELDRGIFLAHVSEAEAAVKVAKAKVEVQRAALERARLAVRRATTDHRLAQDQAAGTQARDSEAERELQRKLVLARTGNVPDRDVTQARAARDTAAAELSGALDQVVIKEQAIAMAQAEVQMAEADLANAEAVVEQRQAALDQARVDLDRSVLRAPIDGVIIKRDVNPGQTVAVALEAKTLFTIANDLSRMEVQGKIDEADVGRLAVGQVAHFTVDAYPERDFSGTVLQVRKAPETTQNVVTYTAIISAQNPDLLLYPGMTATLRITVNRSGEVLKIPTEALRFRPSAALDTAAPGDAATIWVPGGDGRPAPVAVGIGLSDESSAEVRTGPVAEGQPVIVGIAAAPSGRGILGLRLGF